MKKNNKLLLAGAAVAAFYLFANKSAAAEEHTGYPIIYNKYHPDVKLLQAALNVNQDGIIGPVTLAAWSKAYGGEIQKGYEIASYSELVEWINELKAKTITPPWIGLNGIKTLG